MEQPSDFTVMPLGKVQQELSRYPQLFAERNDPVFIEHQGEVIMVLSPLEFFIALSGAVEFLRQRGLESEFGAWLDTQALWAPEDEGGVAELEIDDFEEDAEWEGLSRGILSGPSDDRMRAFIRQKLMEDPDFRNQMKQNLEETQRWIAEAEENSQAG